MEAESFNNPGIIKFINDHFVPVRVNIDKEKKIASSYFIRALPSSWFLEPDGSKITIIPGYVDPELFLAILKYISSESYKKMTLRQYIDSSK